MTEINYAELEKQIWEKPTVAQCRRMGSTHAAYGWARNPLDHWSEEHREAYNKGWRDYHAKPKG